MPQGNSQAITCDLITGEKKTVLAAELKFRPAAYALIYDYPNLLLVNTKSTGKWFFPGGAINLGESIEDGLRREVQEETGYIIHKLHFFRVNESFYYYDNQGYHCLNFIYTADLQGNKQQPIENDPTDEADKFEWVDINTLNPKNLQGFAAEVVKKFISTL